MANKSNQGCILCGDNPQEGMHLSGQRFIKGRAFTYMLCKSCCLHNHEYNDSGVNRNKLWGMVDKKLLNKSA